MRHNNRILKNRDVCRIFPLLLATWSVILSACGSSTDIATTTDGGEIIIDWNGPIPASPPTERTVRLRTLAGAELTTELHARDQYQLGQQVRCQDAGIPIDSPPMMEDRIDNVIASNPASIADRAPASSDANTPSGVTSNTNASITTIDTNNQETQVDEGNLIKLFGGTAAVVHQNAVQIFTVWPSSAFAKVASIVAPANVTALVTLDDTHVVIISKTAVMYYDDFATAPGSTRPAQANAPAGDVRAAVIAQLVDLSAPNHPRVMQETWHEGTLAAVRVVEHALLLATNFSGNYSQVPDLRAFNRFAAKCADAQPTVATAITTAVAARADASYLPRQWQKRADGSFAAIDTAASIATNDYTRDLNLLSIARITLPQVADHPEITTARVLGSGWQIYVSASHLFAAQTLWSNAYGLSDTVERQTAIHEFDLAPLSYRTSTLVQGVINNPYWMSESANVLRVATEIHNGNTALRSRIVTLDTTSNALAQLGHTEEIGFGERLYAVRYFRDRAFVVTYRAIDPFFTIDLRDPKNPQVRGALELPGYSSYLQMIDDTHVLGVGQTDASVDEQGQYDPAHLKLSLFDVSDFDHPTIVATQNIASPSWINGYTPNFDPHQVLFDEANHLLLLPVHEYAQSTLQLFRVGTHAIHQVGALNIHSRVERSSVIHDGANTGIVVLGAHMLGVSTLHNDMSIDASAPLEENFQPDSDIRPYGPLLF